MSKAIGIDLGTVNTVICLKSKGVVLSTPTLIAVKHDSGEIVAVDADALAMLGKAPKGIDVVKPLQNGVISNPTLTAKLIRGLFEHTNTISFFSRPTVVICVPYNITELEKKAVEDAVFAAGARSVALIEEPLAAAIGIGLNVQNNSGTLLVDIGGGTTEASVISLGGVVKSNADRVAGNSFDEAIVSYLVRKRGIRIGETQAEFLKKKIGSAHPSHDNGVMEISGHSLENMLGVTMKIHSHEIREAITPCLDRIIVTIKKTLEETPPELSSDIFDRGIVLTGGGALLPGIDRLLTEQTKLKVRIARYPLYSVCLGIHKIIQTEGNLDNLLQARGR